MQWLISTHIYLPEHCGPVWTRRGLELVGKEAFGVATPEAHIQAVDEAGASHFAVVGLQIAMMGMHIPNDFIGTYLHSHKDRAIGVGSVDPTQAGAPQRLRDAVKEWGLSGVNISPPYQGFHPHSEEAYAIYRTAADLGIFVMFHQASVFAPDGHLEVASPTLIDKVAREFRGTKFLLAHFGKPWMNEIVELMMKNPNVYADVSTLPIKTWQLYTGLRPAALRLGLPLLHAQAGHRSLPRHLRPEDAPADPPRGRRGHPLQPTFRAVGRIVLHVRNAAGQPAPHPHQMTRVSFLRAATREPTTIWAPACGSTVGVERPA